MRFENPRARPHGSGSNFNGAAMHLCARRCGVCEAGSGRRPRGVRVCGCAKVDIAQQRRNGQATVATSAFYERQG